MINFFSFIFILLTFKVNADTIKFITPTINQKFINSVVDVNYQIERNGMLFISNTTTDLLDNKGSILKSVFTDTNVNTSVNVQIDTTNKQGNYYIKITGFGKYNFVSNNVTVLFINIENFIPISVNTSSATATILSSISSTATATETATATATPTATPTASSITSNKANSNNIGLLSFVSVLMILIF